MTFSYLRLTDTLDLSFLRPLAELFGQCYAFQLSGVRYFLWRSKDCLQDLF